MTDQQIAYRWLGLSKFTRPAHIYYFIYIYIHIYACSINIIINIHESTPLSTPFLVPHVPRPLRLTPNRAYRRTALGLGRHPSRRKYSFIRLIFAVNLLIFAATSCWALP